MKKPRKKNKQETKISQIFYTPTRAGSFGGLNALKRVSKAKTSAIKNWLIHQDAYTLHKPVRYKFPRRRVIVSGIDQQWQADLIDVQRLKKENDNHAYLLTIIDVFSKYAWIVPLRNKTASALTKAFQDVFSEGRKPEKLQTDKGSEFRNRSLQQFLKEEEVEFFTTENEDTKASIVERFNRTIKERLWKYFTRKNTLRYVETLPKLVSSYNRSFHRSIGIAPIKVNFDNQEEVWQRLYNQPGPKIRSKQKLQPGDRVRLSKARRQFKKGYLPSWTEELFTVSHVNKTQPVTYTLKDDSGEELKGTFYTEEVQKVGEKEIYRIETILKTRKAGHRKSEYLVKWYGYPPSFNSWIPETALSKYTD